MGGGNRRGGKGLGGGQERPPGTNGAPGSSSGGASEGVQAVGKRGGGEGARDYIDLARRAAVGACMYREQVG